MAYCMAQYRNVYINNGKARPCCWYERKELNNKVDNLIDIVDVFNSDEFEAIRNNPSDRPSGCWKCQMHEDKGGKSHRQLWNEREIDDGVAKLTDLDIYMGNLCNLACVSCSSHNSSKWIAEEQKIFGSAEKTKQDNIDIKLSWDLVKDLKRIKLAGGEVTIMPNHKKFLQQIIDFGVAKNITLVYIVNNTTDPREFKELFDQFNKVEFILSVDGIGEVSDYVRYHSNWQELDRNIQYTIDMGISVSVNCVTSVLNVYHLPEVLNWWDGRGDIFFRLLDYPKHLSIRILKDNDRNIVINKLSKYNEFNHIINVLNEPGSNDWEKFEQWISKLDANRNNSFWRINEQFTGS
jgi:sulfatase maturation enzyme AslB (radical SAM superfamily)